jgi:hypothetical protein
MHPWQPEPGIHPGVYAVAQLTSTWKLPICCADSVLIVYAGSAHRMFLISTKELTPAGAEGGRSQEFTVLGATGNGGWQAAMAVAGDQQPTASLSSSSSSRCS